VHQLFLQVFDAGVLTDRAGRHTYFSDTVIVLTSNIDEFSRRALGFGTEEVTREDFTNETSPLETTMSWKFTDSSSRNFVMSCSVSDSASGM
jgi:ATP-dependent Clp protease ATP-binding subunit ClpA